MTWIELVCLANSRKHGGRCVAGLRLDGGGWVRPVSDADDGRLSGPQYTFSDGREIVLLDIVRVQLVGATPAPFQPENHRQGGDRCQLVGRADWSVVQRILIPTLEWGPELLGGTGDSVPADGDPPPTSLALVDPVNVSWRIDQSRAARRQTRVRFRLRTAWYDLVVTDPRWEERLSSLEAGIHPRGAAGLADTDRLLFCISLGEPFTETNRRYKLVAGVVVLQPETPHRSSTPGSGSSRRFAPAALPPSYGQRITKPKQRYSRAYERWTESEERELMAMHAERVAVAELAARFGRQPSAIRSRLTRLGVLE